jgi:hypothetical protein
MLRSLGFVEKDGKWETLQENLKDTTHVDPDADYVEPNDSDRAHPAEELKNELA